jgi:hypothetical protein
MMKRNAADGLIKKPFLFLDLSLRSLYQIPQPEGLQDGAAKPPEPEAIPWARTQPADISFSTSLQSHSGHIGAGSLADIISSSKQWQQALHWYS